MENRKKTDKYLIISAIILLGIVFCSFFALAERREEDIQAVAATPRKNVLLLGEDRAAGLCDVIMLASLDTQGKQINIVQIPRDTYAEYSPEYRGKLNAAAKRISPDGLCSFLEQSFCIDIDGYIKFDLDVVVKLVDGIGGVEIDVPEDMKYSDEAQGLEIDIKAGRQTLDGRQAEGFLRYRAGYVRGDLDRMDAQKSFIVAMLKKAKSELSPLRAVGLLSSVASQIDTDMQMSGLCEVAMNMVGVDTDALSLATLPGEDIRDTRSGAWYYVMSCQGACELISEFFDKNISPEDFDRSGAFLREDHTDFASIYGRRTAYAAWAQ